MKNTDLHLKFYFKQMLECITKDIILENKYKIVVPLFGAAYAAPNKGTTILS